MNTRIIFCSIAICMFAFCETATGAPKPKKELYVPMDYSTCGYHASEAAIPNVTTVIKINRQDGDCSKLIQQAIDYLAHQKTDNNGHRGAILLSEGIFRIDQPLRISTSGIVVRGAGRKQTILLKQGVERGAAVYIEGNERLPMLSGKPDTICLKGQKTQAGSTKLVLPSHNLKTGERIWIVRPSTKEWIMSLKMNDFGGGLDYTGWKPTDIDLTWDRTVAEVDGNIITIDAPITTTLTSETGNAYIIRHPQICELTECGIENLTIQSEVNSWNPKDEDHCWDGIYMNKVRDCWVKNVEFIHLAGSAVNLQKQTSRVTVEDCIAEKPVSEIGGWRRQTFLTRGQQTLFQRCLSRHGIHDFAAGYCAAGPNAFVQCDSEESLGFSGSIGSWAAGLLFDIVNIDGNDIRFANLEQFQMGTGWNTANSMLWQCTASTIECYSPDNDNRNGAHGCWGTLTGNGEWTSSNDHVAPRSLFYDQLEKRLGKLPFNPQLLPRATNATSSPTVEQAMELAQESLTQPRLTMEMWIDSVQQGNSYPASQLTEKWRKTPIATETYVPSDIIIRNSFITSKAKGLITGNQYNIPWWNGRVKDNFINKEAKPAITRFVPGREGNGWTDRIDSVVDYLSKHRFTTLNHHYGLWYDLRRTDHERVRRADGDVWVPFYEQPFARSGQGKAWEGLSQYDLTKPNLWYWQRLNEFAKKSASKNILLFNQHYFQHNILEAGAHWVDCPWRNVNNINGTDFPEPVPFAGDKRIFVAEQFYNEQNPILRKLHKQYIRMCLDQLKDQPNVVHSISAEYTGPLHFTRFWLEIIAEWEAETGKHPLIALSCTRDVQDSILADPKLNKVVDIIDIRYWHYNTSGLWAPSGGKNMAPRQWMRKMKVGKTGFNEAYRSVREMREKYPGKAVIFSSQQYPSYGWAILMAGGSLPNIPLSVADSPLAAQLLSDLSDMTPINSEGAVALGNSKCGYLIYTTSGKFKLSDIDPGKYTIYTVHPQTGAVNMSEKSVRIDTTIEKENIKANQIYWIRKL